MEAELKSLQSQRQRISEELNLLRKENRELSDRIRAGERRISSIDSQIKDLTTSKEVIVSEHAILRYLERVKGMDLTAIKEEILPAEVRAQIATLRSGRFPVNGDFKLRAKDGVIVTVLTKEEN
jgi:chromosome segregation ATPase